MDTVPVTDAVIQHWLEKAGDRQTVVFCSTVAHARNVTTAFQAANVATILVTGEMPEGERRDVLAAYAAGKAQVVVNVAVLTEGWDHPPTSCVVLLRPSSFKSTMIQMVGRGLRTLDPADFPGVVKRDCIILDFGTSSQIHGCLEQDVNLDLQPGEGEAPTKVCPSCDAEVPIAVMECPICGHVFEPRERATEPLSDFIMTEIDLLKRSSFQWCDLYGDDAALMANGFNAWSGAFFLNGDWHAVGGGKGPVQRRAIAASRQCFTLRQTRLAQGESTDSADLNARRPFDRYRWARQHGFMDREDQARVGVADIAKFQFHRRACCRRIDQRGAIDAHHDIAGAGRNCRLNTIDQAVGADGLDAVKPVTIDDLSRDNAPECRPIAPDGSLEGSKSQRGIWRG